MLKENFFLIFIKFFIRTNFKREGRVLNGFIHRKSKGNRNTKSW